MVNLMDCLIRGSTVQSPLVKFTLTLIQSEEIYFIFYHFRKYSDPLTQSSIKRQKDPTPTETQGGDPILDRLDPL